jgi:F-type H+-transporting ATPase subunit delta
MAENAAIAQPYAKAVFELAHSAGQLAQWSDALQAAGIAVSEADVAALVEAPGTDLNALVHLIAEIAGKSGDIQIGAGTQLQNLLLLLVENKRLLALPEIASAFDALKADVENRVDVTLTTATEIDAAQQEIFVAALKKRFGRDVNLKVELDETLVGGAKLQADDLVIDGSVSTGLAKLTSSLMN